MEIDDIISCFDSHLYPALQENYDNSGPQIVFRGSLVNSILISLDIDKKVLDEALRKNCGLIVSHHPLLFRPVRTIDTRDNISSLIIDSISHRINIYAAHTNLDKLFYDRLARSCGFDDAELLYNEHDLPDGRHAGLGARVLLKKPVNLESLLQKVRDRLTLDYIVFTGDLATMIGSVAFLNGAGGRAIERIIDDFKPDCIITGDVGYHQAKYASDCGVAVIDAGHFGTEIVMLSFLHDLVVDCLTNRAGAEEIRIFVSEVEKNPLRAYGIHNEQQHCTNG